MSVAVMNVHLNLGYFLDSRVTEAPRNVADVRLSKKEGNKDVASVRVIYYGPPPRIVARV
jgi:hypothetical protein